jgi:preprotein translocase subunit Sec61beta
MPFDSAWLKPMSQRRSKKRQKQGPMPAASAGLLRFFEEETQGIKVRPELVVIMSVALILAAVIARIAFQIPVPPSS